MKIWTIRRQWMGNLIPGIGFLIFFSFGIAAGFTRLPILFAISIFGLILSFLLLNRYGLYENARMKQETADLIGDVLETDWFVGYSSLDFRPKLDTHENVGYLRITKDHLIIRGEAGELKIPRKNVRAVAPKLSYHSLIGYGGFIQVETDHRSSSVLIESRHFDTMIANARFNAKLRRLIHGKRD